MSARDGLPEIASLWIGESLSFLELLCLKSFVDAGHPVTLYTYGELRNPPDFCTIKDAREIWDNTDILVHAGKKSPAIHADLWRIRLLRQTDAIWVDTDAYCHQPFRPVDGYLVGWESAEWITNGVLRLPRDSPALALFDDFLQRANVPPWWDARERREYLTSAGGVDFQTAPWGTTGPRGLTYFMKQTGEARHALPPHVLYPWKVNRKGLAFRLPRYAEAYIQPDTISLHFYNSGFRRSLAKNTLSAESFIGQLCKKHQIALPAAEPPKRANPVQKRGKWRRKRASLMLDLVLSILARSRGRSGGRMRYVQVGANDGKIYDPIFEYTARGDFTGVLIEPSPRYFADLQKRYRNNPDIITVKVGIAEEEGTRTLYQLAPAYEPEFPDWARGCASMIRAELEKILASVKPLTKNMIVKTKVPVMRLDDVLKEHDAEDAEMLVVDVEGYEARVFRSVDFAAFRPYFILFEHIKMQKADAAAIHAQLQAAGYQMWIVGDDIMALHRDWLPAQLPEVLTIMEVPTWDVPADQG